MGKISDRQVLIGDRDKKDPICDQWRLIEVKVGKTWRSYLTSVLDPSILPPYVVIDLSFLPKKTSASRDEMN